ncbi:uncharacterized protein LOC144166558 [Haemaphysalis longicornis]
MDDHSYAESPGREARRRDTQRNVPRSEPEAPSQMPAVSEALNPVHSQELLVIPATPNIEPPLAVAFNPVCTTLLAVPATLYVAAPPPLQQHNTYVMLQPGAGTSTPYLSAPSKAPQCSGTEAVATGGRVPTNSNALGPRQTQGSGHVVEPEAGHAGSAAGGPSIDPRSGGNARANRRRQARERHKQQDRDRRDRLSDAFSGLRTVVPGLNSNANNATVTERAVEYTRHMRLALVAKYGKERANEICKEFAHKFHLYGPIQEFSD